MKKFLRHSIFYLSRKTLSLERERIGKIFNYLKQSEKFLHFCLFQFNLWEWGDTCCGFGWNETFRLRLRGDIPLLVLKSVVVCRREGKEENHRKVLSFHNFVDDYFSIIALSPSRQTCTHSFRVDALQHPEKNEKKKTWNEMWKSNCNLPSHQNENNFQFLEQYCVDKGHPIKSENYCRCRKWKSFSCVLSPYLVCHITKKESHSTTHSKVGKIKKIIN